MLFTRQGRLPAHPGRLALEGQLDRSAHVRPECNRLQRPHLAMGGPACEVQSFNHYHPSKALVRPAGRRLALYELMEAADGGMFRTISRPGTASGARTQPRASCGTGALCISGPAAAGCALRRSFAKGFQICCWLGLLFLGPAGGCSQAVSGRWTVSLCASRPPSCGARPSVDQGLHSGRTTGGSSDGTAPVRVVDDLGPAVVYRRSEALVHEFTPLRWAGGWLIPGCEQLLDETRRLFLELGYPWAGHRRMSSPASGSSGGVSGAMQGPGGRQPQLFKSR